MKFLLPDKSKLYLFKELAEKSKELALNIHNKSIKMTIRDATEERERHESHINEMREK